MNSPKKNVINQVLCGDALDVLKNFDANSVDLVVTDPPYLCNYTDKSNRTIANDNTDSNVLAVYDEIYRLMKPRSYLITFYGWEQIAAFSAAWQKAGFRVVGRFVWLKDYTSSGKGFMNYQHESAFLLTKGHPDRPKTLIDDVQPWVYSGNKVHPTEKSVDIITPLIKCFSDVGDVVLDPFLGSGSTAVAAALTNRSYIGVELEEHYCNCAQKRLAGVERYLAA